MVSFRFEGGKELAATLNALPARVSRKIIVDALKDAAEPIRRHAASAAPREPGAPDLADNIVVSASQRIGSTGGGKWTRRDEGEHAVAVGPAKGFFYGLMQEYGTVHHGAQPFMRPAFDSQHQKALKIVGEAMWVALAGKGIHRPTQMAPSPVQSMGRGL